jgi:hypothetical protein
MIFCRLMKWQVDKMTQYDFCWLQKDCVNKILRSEWTSDFVCVRGMESWQNDQAYIKLWFFVDLMKWYVDKMTQYDFCWLQRDYVNKILRHEWTNDFVWAHGKLMKWPSLDEIIIFSRLDEMVCWQNDKVWILLIAKRACWQTCKAPKS